MNGIIKKAVLGSLLTACLIFTACSGGKEKKQPPKACADGTPVCQQMHPDDQASWQNLMNTMEQVKGTCVGAFAPAAIEAAKVTYATGGQIPPAVIFTNTPAAAALQASTPQRQTCIQAINNLIANASTMNGGRYWQRPDVQEWLRDNLMSIGARIATAMPPQLMADPNFVRSMYGVGQYLVGTQISPFINQLGRQQLTPYI